MSASRTSALHEAVIILLASDSGFYYIEVIMTRQEVLDLYFMDARCKLIEIAAFLDRIDRASGSEDFRITEFRKALRELDGRTGRAEKVLLALSDPTSEPIPAATTKAACGANPGLSGTGTSK